MNFSASANTPATTTADGFTGRSAGRMLPVVREMAKPAPELLWVILDTYCPGATPANLELREQTVRFAATLIDYAFDAGYRVGLATSLDAGPTVIPARAAPAIGPCFLTPSLRSTATCQHPRQHHRSPVAWQLAAFPGRRRILGRCQRRRILDVRPGLAQQSRPRDNRKHPGRVYEDHDASS